MTAAIVTGGADMAEMKPLPAEPTRADVVAAIAEVHSCIHEQRVEFKKTLAEIKRGQNALHTQVKTLANAVAAITPTVDELKADKIRAQERAAVIRELAEEKARGDAVADKADERRSRWITPLLAAAVPVILALALGWANDHFHHHGTEAKASTTVTTTVDRPR